MDTKTRVIAVIQSVTGKKLPEDEDENLFDSGLLDSFALPDVVSGLEEEFGISIPDADLNPRKFESVERITGYLESKM